ncbi:hypothetical protein GWI33_002101 [Rhynchophorus ferrugineus]|uniref:Uncharacterized protein n=1 Tax=Rhynchophorus ferrugineus TaxID=354439 RepID=A0A834ML73_RHYFE|nr:hypothetical protein GWI33_002101 [Rhynchophorus ferrugineus]
MFHPIPTAYTPRMSPWAVWENSHESADVTGHFHDYVIHKVEPDLLVARSVSNFTAFFVEIRSGKDSRQANVSNTSSPASRQQCAHRA